MNGNCDANERSILYLVASPYFDGIGILYDDIVISTLNRRRCYLLDVIIPFSYPAIKNFNVASFLHWRLWRRRQFASRLASSYVSWIQLGQVNKTEPMMDIYEFEKMVLSILNDHAVCNNFTEKQRIQLFAQTNKFNNKLRNYLTALKNTINQHGFDEVVVFNGRNPISRLLQALCEQLSIKFTMLEYGGSKGQSITYLRSPVDLFDMDARSEYIAELYALAPVDVREDIAIKVLRERTTNLEPLSRVWGMTDAVPIEDKERKILSFFAASEDEYPAIKPSKFGFPDPTKQYEKFKDICLRLRQEGMGEKFTIYLKLHPRYEAESQKLATAAKGWRTTIDYVKSIGIDLRLYPSSAAPYDLIQASDMVLSFGSTAWEATFLGVTSIMLGPNSFSTHGCCYIANSINEVIDLIRLFPKPKPIETTFPNAWAWSELGVEPRYYSPLRQSESFLSRFRRIFDNRFYEV
jgi:hypothetical protein